MNRGPLALIGGREHFAESEAIDRRLLDEVGASNPWVAIVPVASTSRQLPLAAALARNHWTKLGARVSIAVPGEGEPEAVAERIDRADILVLTGGHPNKLVARLATSPLWDRILARWESGAGLAGSSAGAMALFEWRIRLYPPNPLSRLPGLGLLSGYVAAPHFDRLRVARWGGRFGHKLGGLGVLGLDEATGLVGRDGHYTVVGRGSVTLLEGGVAASFPAGARVSARFHQEFVPYVPAAPPWHPRQAVVRELFPAGADSALANRPRARQHLHLD